ncbi:MAG: hypothetical protein IIV15_03850, partial [Ruminococcus sp.]|nr:hypothetical protein [Ruminococcus sp.]
LINGQVQQEGEDFTSKGSQCDIKKNIFSTDMSGAYPADADCRSWHRRFPTESGILTRMHSWAAAISAR